MLSFKEMNCSERGRRSQEMSYQGIVGHVDLDRGRVESERMEERLTRRWGGGSGIASWRLWEELSPRIDPLDPGNVVWVIGGPLTGTIAPCSGRVEVVTKSALTGLMGLSNAGGLFGAGLKQAGWDGIAIRGASEKPVYLLVRPGSIEIRDASHLWGLDTFETSRAIAKDLGDPSERRVKVMAIGPAGENLVVFACLINEHCHAAARGGAGAVWGAKKLKAIAVDTEFRSIPASDHFRRVCAAVAEKIKTNETCQAYSRLGSLPVSDFWFEMGCLPGLNFQKGVLPRWRETRGTERIKSFVTKPDGTCYHCAMPCFNRVEVVGGDYDGLKITSGTFVQVVMEFGAKCGIESLPAIWKCKEICHRLGMDYGSASGVIAFAMELFQRGLLTGKDLKVEGFGWGDAEGIFHLLHKIAYREGIGAVLAEGSARASAKLGPETSPFVMAVKGMEMIGADVRSGPRAWCLGSLTSPRGGDNVRSTHMKGEVIVDLSLLRPENVSSWDAYSKAFVSRLDMFPEVKEAIYGHPPRVNPFTFRGKALMTKWFEDLFAAVNAVGLCTFPADKLALGPTDYARMLSAYLEEEVSPAEFMTIGERIFNVQRLFQVREGVSRKDDAWPDRFFEEPLSDGPAKGAKLSREIIEEVLDEYYKARGWDPLTGAPTRDILNRLGLAGIWQGKS